MNTASSLLNLSDITVSYGPVQALSGISFHVNSGEIVALLGANGSGKSTILKAISGLVRPTIGSIVFDGEPIHGLRPQAIYRRGLIHVQEGRMIFPGLNTRDNLLLGAANRQGERSTSAIKQDMKRVLDLFPPLERVMGQSGWMLSGGQQQALAVGQGLMARPRLLMLDEPSLGLAPILVKELFKAIQRINEQGTTILLVEQNVMTALKVAHRAYVLELGEITVSGTSVELKDDQRIQESYLGGRAHV